MKITELLKELDIRYSQTGLHKLRIFFDGSGEVWAGDDILVEFKGKDDMDMKLSILWDDIHGLKSKEWTI